MEKTTDIVFGERLRTARVAKGMTQQSAADEFGISLRGYCRWEKGEREPTYAALVNIAKTLDVSLDWLLGLSDEAPAGE